MSTRRPGRGSSGIPEGGRVFNCASQGEGAGFKLAAGCEVACITEREQGLPQAQTVLAAVQQLPLQVLPADQDAVFAAAHLKANYRLSFADAFAAAAAQKADGVLVTGDLEFRTLSDVIRIRWLPR